PISCVARSPGKLCGLQPIGFVGLPVLDLVRVRGTDGGSSAFGFLATICAGDKWCVAGPIRARWPPKFGTLLFPFGRSAATADAPHPNATPVEALANFA